MFEYIKVFWTHTLDEYPIIIMYEADMKEHRKANRAINVFANHHMENVEDCYEGATLIIPIPTVDELNHNFRGDEIRACNMEKTEFLRAWESSTQKITTRHL